MAKQLKPLHEISEETFDVLQSSGVLQQIYPGAPKKFSEIQRPGDRPKPLDNPDFNRLVDFTEKILDELEEKGYAKDFRYYSFETLFTTIYGRDFFTYFNKLKISE